MNLKVSAIFFFTGILFCSCDKTRVYDEYKTVGKSWDKKTVVKFDLPVIDSTKMYNLFINLRDNDAYEFSNLFLIVAMEQPKGVVKVDTLEYEMANNQGKLLGEGFTDIKENKLFYKERFQFKPSGKYKIEIRQAVRQNGKISGVEKLNGITEVGFRVESIQ